jgi:pyrroloquinoline quinone (PQQ) biosynthesis protein C
MYSQYERFIQNYNLENTNFYHFCQNATREEFLKSQIGFFYAVQAFPQMLCKLASQIESSDIRLKVAENIWEEHGNGVTEHFHTQSFMTYLCSLGLADNSLTHNFFVDNWIKQSLGLSLPAAKYSAYLAGIEYIYAKISLLICRTLTRFDLLCEQNHYEKHGELDFHHAQDLLDVAYAVDNNDHYEVFCSSVNTFIDLFNQMTFMTQKEVDHISQEEIAFYYSREDSKVELSCLTSINPRVLTVCSGGEHIIHIKNLYPQSTVIALDINDNQIELTKNKILNLSDHRQYPIFNHGKFELIFKYFASKINMDDIHNIKQNDYVAIKKLELLCRDIFSNHNLNTIFIEEATKYSSDDFSLHFFTVFLNKIKDMNNECCNMANILGRTLPSDLPVGINTQNINYFYGDFNSFFAQSTEKFDLISISNIGDWMPQKQFIDLISSAIAFLNKGGHLIARKLLGDYSLKEVFAKHFNVIYSQDDDTGFYKECMVGIK